MPDHSVFEGCLPALMTPCNAAREPDFDALAAKGRELVARGMGGVVYCGSVGEWPLIPDADRCRGVEALVGEDIPVVVGTGAQSTARAVDLARHAREVGAAGLMVIPRVLSRGTSPAAQRAHFAAVLRAGGDLPAVIYNSPYYGFETKADLFFDLSDEFDNLVGFKEFGGAASLDYAAEHITSGRDDLHLVVGVDTQVVHGIVGCGASGVITGIGNVFPDAVLRLIELCRKARDGDDHAMHQARELDDALAVLARFDEGPDLVLYFKRLKVLEGNPEYAFALNPDDELSSSQRAHVDSHWARFRRWWESNS